MRTRILAEERQRLARVVAEERVHLVKLLAAERMRLAQLEAAERLRVSQARAVERVRLLQFQAAERLRVDRFQARDPLLPELPPPQRPAPLLAFPGSLVSPAAPSSQRRWITAAEAKILAAATAAMALVTGLLA